MDLNNNTTISITIQPVHALRCIEIELPRYIIRHIKCLHSLDRKKAYMYFPNRYRVYRFPLQDSDLRLKEHYNYGKYHMRKGSNARL